MDERSVDTLSQKLTVPLQLQLDSVSDGLKEEYRNLLGSLRDDLYSLKMETAGFHGTSIFLPSKRIYNYWSFGICGRET